MKALRVLLFDAADYEAELTGENLGWAILSRPTLSFRPVHRVQFHPTDGPVVILGDTVFEVEPATDDVFRSDDEAMNAYYAAVETMIRAQTQERKEAAEKAKKELTAGSGSSNT